MRPRNASIHGFLRTHTLSQPAGALPALRVIVFGTWPLSLLHSTYTHTTHTRPLPDSCLGRQLLLSKEALALFLFSLTCSLFLYVQFLFRTAFSPSVFPLCSHSSLISSHPTHLMRPKPSENKSTEGTPIAPVFLTPVPVLSNPSKGFYSQRYCSIACF